MTTANFQGTSFPKSASEVTQPVAGAIMHKDYVKTIGFWLMSGAARARRNLLALYSGLLGQRSHSRRQLETARHRESKVANVVLTKQIFGGGLCDACIIEKDAGIMKLENL